MQKCSQENFFCLAYVEPIEKEMATHSSILAWRMPGMGSYRVGHNWSDLAVAAALCGTQVKTQVKSVSVQLCDSMGCSPPGSSVHGILQARILEWVAIPFSRDLLNPGIEPMSPALAGFFTIEPQGKPMWNPNIKAINITQLVQIIFNAWSGYFEYVGYLPHGTPFIVLNYCLNLITINFRWSLDVEQEISSLKLHKPLLTHLISHSNFSIHCTNLFFLFFLHFSWVFNLPWSNEA